MKKLIPLIALCMFLSLEKMTAQTPTPDLITLTAKGYTLDVLEDAFKTDNISGKKIDLILFDLSLMENAKTKEDSVSVWKNVYADPGKYSYVTGIAKKINDHSFSLATSFRFKFKFDMPGLALFVLENKGGTPSTHPKALSMGTPPVFAPNTVAHCCSETCMGFFDMYATYRQCVGKRRGRMCFTCLSCCVR